MAAVTVTHLRDDWFRVETRGHRVLVDQPAGRVGVGSTPVELLVMALASCTAHYAVGYLHEQELPHHDLRVDCRWTMRADPPRMGTVKLTVTPPVHLDGEQHAGMLLAAVDRCTVHNTLRHPRWCGCVSPTKRRIVARRRSPAGLDIVRGHSSHHPRPIEVHRGRLILYGCG